MEEKSSLEEPSGHVCDLCGAVSPSIFCSQCNKRYFCGSCDDMYHTHPKRQTHVRQPLIDTKTESPVRPPKKRSHLQTSAISGSRDSFVEKERLDTSGVPTPPSKRRSNVQTPVEPSVSATSLSSLPETSNISSVSPSKRQSDIQMPVESLISDENLITVPEKLTEFITIPVPPPKRKSSRTPEVVKNISCESISEKTKDESDVFKIPPVPPPRRSHSQTSVDKGSTESLEKKSVLENLTSAPVPPKRRSHLRTPESETSLPALDDDKEVLFSKEQSIPVPPKRHFHRRTPDSVLSLPAMSYHVEAMFSGDSSTLPIIPKRSSRLKTPDSVTSLPTLPDQKEAMFSRADIPTPPPRKSIRTCSSITSLPNFSIEYTTAPTPPPRRRSRLPTPESLPDRERASATHSPTPPPRRKKRELELSNLSLQSSSEHKRECLQSQDEIKHESEIKESTLKERRILQSYENIIPPPRRSKPQSASDLVLSKIPFEEKRATLPRSADYSQVVKRPISATLALGEDLQDWGKVTSAPDVRSVNVWENIKQSQTEFQEENILFEDYVKKQSDYYLSDVHQSKDVPPQTSSPTQLQASGTVAPSQIHPHFPYSQPPYTTAVPHLSSVYSSSCPQCYVHSWSNLTPTANWPTEKEDLALHKHGMKRSHSAIHDPSSVHPGYHPAGPGLYPYGSMVPHICPHGHHSPHSYATDSSSQSSSCQRRPRKKRSSSRKKKTESDERQKHSESGSESGEVDVHSFTSEELKVTSEVKPSTEDYHHKHEDTWVCQHCTYINAPGSNICEICCKTTLPETFITKESEDKEKPEFISGEDVMREGHDQKLKCEEDFEQTTLTSEKIQHVEETSSKLDTFEQASEILSEKAKTETEKHEVTLDVSHPGDQKESSCQTSHESLGEFSSRENLEFSSHPSRAVMSDVSPQTSPLLGRKGLRRPTPPPLGFSPLFGRSAHAGHSQQLISRTTGHSDLTVAGRGLLPHEPVHDSSGYGTTDSLYHSWSHPSLFGDASHGQDRSFSPRPLSPRISETKRGESGLSASDGVQVGYATQKSKIQWESDPGQLSRDSDFVQSRLLGENHNEELKNLIREAEQYGFSIEDVQVALERCGREDPLVWLEENWQRMIENVAALATDYSDDKSRMEIGIVSPNEARDALRTHRGDMRVAILECVNSRKLKIEELSARGNFNEDDIAEALTANQGNIELAYADLVKSTLQPFLYSSWEQKDKQSIQETEESTVLTVSESEKRKSPSLISKLHSRMKDIEKREKETLEHEKHFSHLTEQKEEKSLSEELMKSEVKDSTEIRDIQKSIELLKSDIHIPEEIIPVVENGNLKMQHEEKIKEESERKLFSNIEETENISQTKNIEIDKKPISVETYEAESPTVFNIKPVDTIKTEAPMLQASKSLTSVARPLTPDMSKKKTSILQTSKSLSFESTESRKPILHTTRPLTPVIKSSKYEDDFSRAISSELLAEEMGDLFASEETMEQIETEESIVETKEEIQAEVKECIMEEKTPDIKEKIEKDHTSTSEEDFEDAPGVAQVEDITEYGSVKYGDYGFASPAAQMYASLIQSAEVTSPKKKKQKSGKTEITKPSPATGPSLKWVSPGRTILAEDKWPVKPNLTTPQTHTEESHVKDHKTFKEEIVPASTFHNGKLLYEKSDQLDSNGNKIASDNESLTSDTYADAFEEHASFRSFKSFSDTESLASDAYTDALEPTSPPPFYSEYKSDTESLISDTFTDAPEELSSQAEFKTPPMTDTEIDSEGKEQFKKHLISVSDKLKPEQVLEQSAKLSEIHTVEKTVEESEQESVPLENVESWAVASLYESLMSEVVVEKKPLKSKSSTKKSVKDSKSTEKKKEIPLTEEKIFKQKEMKSVEGSIPEKLISEDISKHMRTKEMKENIEISEKYTKEIPVQKDVIKSEVLNVELPTSALEKTEQINLSDTIKYTSNISETSLEDTLTIKDRSLEKESTYNVTVVPKLCIDDNLHVAKDTVKDEKEGEILSKQYQLQEEKHKEITPLKKDDESLLKQESSQYFQLQESVKNSYDYEKRETIPEDLITDVGSIDSKLVEQNLIVKEIALKDESDMTTYELQRDNDILVQNISVLESDEQNIRKEFHEMTTETDIDKIQVTYAHSQKIESDKMSYDEDKHFSKLREPMETEVTYAMDDTIVEKFAPTESENLPEEELQFYDDDDYFITEEREQDLQYLQEEVQEHFSAEIADTFADVESSLKQITEELEEEERLFLSEPFLKETKEIFTVQEENIIEKLPKSSQIQSSEQSLPKDDVTSLTEKFPVTGETYDHRILPEAEIKREEMKSEGEKVKRKIEDEEKLFSLDTKYSKVDSSAEYALLEDTQISSEHIKLEEVKDFGIKIKEDHEKLIKSKEETKDISAKEEQIVASSKVPISEEYTEVQSSDYKIKLPKIEKCEVLGTKAILTQQSKETDLEKPKEIETLKEHFTERSEIRSLVAEEHFEEKAITYEKQHLQLKSVKEFGMKAAELQQVEDMGLEETKDISQKEMPKECFAESSEAETSASEEYAEEKTLTYKKQHLQLKSVKEFGMKAAELQQVEDMRIRRNKRY
ncbi:E3 ubiquitin-protein ligase lubel-like [Centruroides vittatus]|uniref:E3 ubiquitin-protein ligase lubel-like n=1 Tax=Centruroides vittatus TaxID=120091 RepID=UPI0035104758